MMASTLACAALIGGGRAPEMGYAAAR